MNLYKRYLSFLVVIISVLLVIICSAFKVEKIHKLEDRVIVFDDENATHIYYPNDSLYDYFSKFPANYYEIPYEGTYVPVESDNSDNSQQDDKGGAFLFFIFFIGMLYVLIMVKARKYPYTEGNYSSAYMNRFSIIRKTTNKSKIHETTSWFLFTSKYDTVLTKYYAFYRTLSTEKKKVFIQRVKNFIEARKFEGRKDIVITEEMKIVVAAVAVQVTFGFKNYLLEKFSLIILYPDEYLSKSTQQYHKGETNAYGVIVFSWKDFVFGLKYDSDNLNLGFHEFAHAVFMSERAYKLNPGFLYYHQQWKELSSEPSIRRRIDSNQLFRRYANQNEHEFFAIALENFFETPDKFKQQLPELYATLSNMLNQDPLNPHLLVNEYEEFELAEAV